VDSRTSWPQDLRRCVGPAVYCEAALFTGVYETGRLEGELRRRTDSDFPSSNTMRALRNGGTSRSTTLVNLQNALPKSGILYWAYHPIFLLLDTDHEGSDFGPVVTYALDTIWSPLKQSFWPWLKSGSEPGSADPNLQVRHDKALLLRLLETERYSTYDLSPMDALVLHVAMYFQAKRIIEPEIARTAAGATHQHFHLAAFRHPQLLMNWASLARRMDAKIWAKEGLAYPLGPLLTDHNHHLRRRLHESFPASLLKLAEANERKILSPTPTRSKKLT